MKDLALKEPDSYLVCISEHFYFGVAVLGALRKALYWRSQWSWASHACSLEPCTSGLRSLYISMSSLSNDGVPHASLCCALVDVITEMITFQPVRRRYTILLGPQYKRHHGMGGKRSLSTDNLCSLPWEKSIQGPFRCTNAGFPASERT